MYMFTLFVKTIFRSLFIFTRVFLNIEKIIPEYSFEHASTLARAVGCSHS